MVVLGEKITNWANIDQNFQTRLVVATANVINFVTLESMRNFYYYGFYLGKYSSRSWG